MDYLTSGESHGPFLTAIISDFPANVPLDQNCLLHELKQRQSGYGRGGRMQIETDQVQITSGVRFGETIGSPIGLLLANRDFANWQEVMSIWPTVTNDAHTRASNDRKKRVITHPRPGHADLVGGLKYNQIDLRNVLERASARETTMRVAIGSLCTQFLQQFGIDVLGFVTEIGSVALSKKELVAASQNLSAAQVTQLHRIVETNSVRTLTETTATEMITAINQAKDEHTTLGGKIRVIVNGLPSGLGSYINSKTKLDAQLSAAMMSINAIKGVSFGDGFDLASQTGAFSNDQITYQEGKWGRKSNHQGGLEGGMTNGQSLLIDLVMKPIPTQPQGSPTVDFITKEDTRATVERADVTAVPAASTIAQAMTAITLMNAFCEMFGHDDLMRIKANYQQYLRQTNG